MTTRKLSDSEVTILLVEDDDTLRGLNDRLIRRLGFHTVLATNGQDALNKLEGHPGIDCILMDCLMPVMDGFEATRKVRQDPRRANLPIIALTGSSSEHDSSRMKLAGMNDYLKKPVIPADLEALMNRWVTQGSLTHSGVSPPEQEFPAIEGLDTSAGLAYMFGDQDLYVRILRRFLSGQENFPERFCAALDDGDRELAEREIHTLKTILQTIGASQLFSSAVELENMCSGNPRGGVFESLTAKFTTDLERVLTAIREQEHELAGLLAESDESRTEVLQQLRVMVRESDTRALNLVEGLLASSDGNDGLQEWVTELVTLLRAYDFESANELLNLISTGGSPVDILSTGKAST